MTIFLSFLLQRRSQSGAASIFAPSKRTEPLRSGRRDSVNAIIYIGRKDTAH